jgi:hypothetical protein
MGDSTADAGEASTDRGLGSGRRIVVENTRQSPNPFNKWLAQIQYQRIVFARGPRGEHNASDHQLHPGIDGQAG